MKPSLMISAETLSGLRTPRRAPRTRSPSTAPACLSAVFLVDGQLATTLRRSLRSVTLILPAHRRRGDLSAGGSQRRACRIRVALCHYLFGSSCAVAFGRPPTGESWLARCETKHPLPSDSARDTSCRRAPLFLLGRTDSSTCSTCLGRRGPVADFFFLQSDFGRPHRAALAGHGLLEQRSTRSLGRGTGKQSKVDGWFTRSVERDNLMKSGASGGHQDALWDERLESIPRTDRQTVWSCLVELFFFFKKKIPLFSNMFTVFFGLLWQVNTEHIFPAVLRSKPR